MGGSTTTNQNQSQTSQLTPWAPAAGQIQGLLSGLGPSISNLNGGQNVQDILTKLYQGGLQPNPLAAPSLNAGTSLLNGGANYGSASDILKSGYNNGTAALSPYTSGSALDPSTNPALAQELDVARQGAINSVNPMFAAAGRLGSPANAQALGRGITQAETPILENAANRQVGAINSAGALAGSTAAGLSGLDAANAGILGAGIGAAGTAFGNQSLGPQQALQAALMQNQLPLQNAGALSGILGPLAGMFGTQTGSGTSTSTQSLPWYSPINSFANLLSAWKGGGK